MNKYRMHRIFLLIAWATFGIVSVQAAVTGRIVGSNNINVGIQGASITFSGSSNYSANTDIGGHFTIMNMASGNYTYIASAQNYSNTNGSLSVGSTDIIMGDIVVNELAYPPRMVVAEPLAPGGNMRISWQAPSAGTNSFSDSFDSYVDFSLSFGDWSLRDVDLSETYGYANTTYPHYQSPMAYMIFNPQSTIPPLSGYPAHSGYKYAACFSAFYSPNNDWLISPSVNGGGVLRFWARSAVADYGLERFRVGVSTTGTYPQMFNIISGPGYLQAPTAWTEYVFDLSQYAGDQIYIGIQCVSFDAFVFMVDDFQVQCTTGNDAFPEAETDYLSDEDSSINRYLQGYKVYRLLAEDYQDEGTWTELTPSPVNSYYYTDSAWPSLPMGTYCYAVKAVYTNNVLSSASFSNSLSTGMMGTLQGVITETVSGLPIAGATVALGSFHGISGADGSYSVEAYEGQYSVHAYKQGYSQFYGNVSIFGSQIATLNIMLTETLNPPDNLNATLNGRDVYLSWDSPNQIETDKHQGPRQSPCQNGLRALLTGYKVYRDAVLIAQITNPLTNSYTDNNLEIGCYIYGLSAVYTTGESTTATIEVITGQSLVPLLYAEGFEEYQDFVLEFAPWILEDMDSSPTVSIPGIQYPNSGSQMAYMIFNPNATVPPMQSLQAHSGSKMAGAFCSQSGASLNRMISPRLSLQENSSISFYAMSLSNSYEYGSFILSVSTHPEPDSWWFQPVSGTGSVLIPLSWEKFEYDLSAYDNMDIYIAILTLSANITAVFIDDIEVRSGLPPTLSVSPTSHDFGLVYLGTSVAQEFEISNAGSDMLEIYDISFLGNDMMSCSMVSELPWVLQTGESETLTVLFNPTENGNYNATLSISHSLSALPLSISICGTASDLVPPTNFSISADEEIVQLNWSNPASIPDQKSINVLHNACQHKERTVLLGYKIHRNGALIYQITNPQVTQYRDQVSDSGNYTYELYAIYQTGESVPVAVQVYVSQAQSLTVFADGFETYTDFVTEFAPWVLLDMDNNPTVNIPEIQYPNSGTAMAFTILNPSATNPPLSCADPYIGNKMAACFTSVGSPNDDWLIIPGISLQESSSLKFFARSLNYLSAGERFEVCVSTIMPLNLADFQIISGASAVIAPENWTRFDYDLTMFDNQTVSIAIHCVSPQGHALLVDNFSVRSGAVDVDDPTMPLAESRLLGNYPNPFNPQTTVRYSMKESGPVAIEIYNMKGQLVKKLVNCEKAAGNYTVVWNGRDMNERLLSSGVYYYKMISGSYSSTKKMIMLK